MAVLKIDVIVNDTDAEAKLDRIESKVKNVTQVSDQHRAAIDKIKDSYTNTFGAADTSAKATEKYTESLSKASTEAVKAASAVETLGAAKVAQVAVISRSGEAWVEEQMAISKATFEMNAANAAAAEMTTAQTTLASSISLTTAGAVGLGGYLGLAVSSGLLWLKFLFDSGEAYLEHTGKLEEFKTAVASIEDTWRNMQIAVGAILLSDLDDVTSWADGVKELTMFAGSWVLNYVAQQVAAFNMLKSLVPSWMWAGENKAPPAPAMFQGQSSVGALNTKGFFREHEVPSAHTFGSPTSGTSKHTTSGGAAGPASIPAYNYFGGIPGGNTFGFPQAKPTGGYDMPSMPTFGIGGISGGAFGQQSFTLTPQQMLANVGVGSSGGLLSQAFGTPEKVGAELSSLMMRAIRSGPMSAVSAGGSYIGQHLMTGLAQTITSGAGLAISGALGGAINAILPGLGSLIGPLLGKIGGLFGMGTAGRDAVKEFSQQITGSSDMNALHALLAEKLPKDAERFWIALTQGVGRNNPQEAKRIIGEINTALSHAPLSMEGQASQAGFSTTAQTQQTAQEAVHLYEFMRDSGQYSASVVEAAWKRANDAMIASGDTTAIAAQKAKDAVSGLTQKIDSLTQSIANEAPEEVMGVVEAQARAQIAALERERTIAQQIIDDLNAQRIVIPVHLDTSGIDLPGIQRGEMPEDWIPPMPDEGFEQPEPMARGGIVRARRGGTLVRVGEAGQDEMITPLGGSGAGGGTAIIEIDGRTMAEITVPHIPGVVKRYGLA